MDSEQRLTITAKGRVWFSRYVVGSDGYHILAEKKQSTIDPDNAEYILDLIESYALHFSGTKVLDAGSWSLTMIENDGTETHAFGSLTDDSDISKWIHGTLPFDNIIAFGYYEEKDEEYNIVKEFAIKEGYFGIRYLGIWKDYNVYEPLFSALGDGIAIVGPPLVILVKGNEIRISSVDECFEIQRAMIERPIYENIKCRSYSKEEGDAILKRLGRYKVEYIIDGKKKII